MKAKGVFIIAVNDTFTDRASEAAVEFIPMAINSAYQTLYRFTNVYFRTVFTCGVVNKKT